MYQYLPGGVDINSAIGIVSTVGYWIIYCNNTWFILMAILISNYSNRSLGYRNIIIQINSWNIEIGYSNKFLKYRNRLFK